MCGIAGKVSVRGPVDTRLVERMCELLEHRGPDSRGLHAGDGVALGIQRLRIIDLETGDQPIYNEDRSVAVVLNGEIYNYRELREQLERRGHTFSTQVDTEVIAHLYEERGPGLRRRAERDVRVRPLGRAPAPAAARARPGRQEAALLREQATAGSASRRSSGA